MKALISPNEDNRIAEVALLSFDVAEPLYWVDCANDVTTEWLYLNGVFLVPEIVTPFNSEPHPSSFGGLQDASAVIY